MRRGSRRVVIAAANAVRGALAVAVARVTAVFRVTAVAGAGAVTVAAIAAGCAGAPVASTPPPQPEPMRIARGHEPGWRLDLDAGRLRFATADGGVRVDATLPAPVVTARGRSYRASDPRGSVVVDIEPRICADTMTGMPHPFAVAVDHEGRRLSGCGGDPGTLLRGAAWVVEDLHGAGIIDSSRLTLEFGADGSLSGRGGCNTYAARWSVDGERLRITRPAATARACAPALMHQEARMLSSLVDASRFAIDATGALRLFVADRPMLLARRP